MGKNILESAKKVWQKAGEGLHTVRKDQMVSYLLVTTALLNLCIVPLVLYLPAVVQRVYHLNAVYYGYMESALPVGVLLGSLVLSRLGFKSDGIIAALIAVLAQGVLHICFGVTKAYWLGLGWLVVIGIQMAVASAVGRTIFQNRVAAATRGTVFGFMNLLTSILQPVGMAVAGVLGQTVGIMPVIIASGIGLMAVALVGLRMFGFRKSIDINTTGAGQE